MKNVRRFWATAIAVSVLAAAAPSQGAMNDPDGLRGLGEGVCVAAGEESPDAAKVGFGAPTLKEALRQSLQKAAVPLSEATRPCLEADLKLHAIPGAGIVSFAVQVSLIDDYQLPRLPGVTVRGPIWSTTILGTALSGNLKATVGGALNTAADAFAQDLDYARSRK